MKYCQKCGKELMDEAVICPGCGCSVETVKAKTAIEDAKDTLDIKPSMAALEIVIAVMLPIVGVVIGIIGLRKKNTTKRYKNTFLITLIVSVVAWIIWAIVLTSM